MTCDAQQAEITEDLQCLARKFFQVTVHHVELLQGPIHPEEAVFFDQFQWRINKFQYPHVQWIQSGPVKSYYMKGMWMYVVYLFADFISSKCFNVINVMLCFSDAGSNLLLTYVTFVQNQFFNRHALVSQIREGKTETG